jgi:valyl-tRNA synthetase
MLTLVPAGLFDAQKEAERLRKQQAKLEKEVAGLAGRLSNPRFLENAQAQVVDETRQAQVQLRISHTHMSCH